MSLEIFAICALAIILVVLFLFVAYLCTLGPVSGSSGGQPDLEPSDFPYQLSIGIVPETDIYLFDEAEIDQYGFVYDTFVPAANDKLSTLVVKDSEVHLIEAIISARVGLLQTSRVPPPKA